MKDTYNHLVPIQAVVPVKVLDATVPGAAVVDLVDFNSALIVFNCGDKVAGDTGTITLKLEHADDSATPGVPGTYANVEAADVLGVTPSSGIIFTLAGGAVAAAVYKCGYVRGKRHIKLTLAENDGNATGTILAVTVVKGHGLNVPAV